MTGGLAAAEVAVTTQHREAPSQVRGIGNRPERVRRFSFAVRVRAQVRYPRTVPVPVRSPFPDAVPVPRRGRRSRPALRAGRAEPLAAAVRRLIVPAVSAPCLVDVLVPAGALEGAHGAEPDVEVRLSLRAHVGVLSAAGADHSIVGRGVRGHRHGGRASRSPGRPDDRDDVLAFRVLLVGDAVALHPA